MNLIDKDAFTQLRRQTCAIGVLKSSVEDYIKDPSEPKFKIFGTGFLIGPLLVMTNRHVLHSMTAFLEKESIPKNRRHVAFLRPEGSDVAQSFHEFEKMAMLTEPLNFDVGLISFRATTDDPIRAVTPVKVPESSTCEIGDPIGVYGYAFGEVLLKREVGERERIYRFGPILQQGYVSGIAPFDHAEHVDRLLLDVRTARGMSGSPVFDPRTGFVHALHTSGVEDTVAFGIPISSEIVSRLVQMSEESSPGDQGTTELNHVARATPYAQPKRDVA